MAMVFSGTQGETADEIATAMGYNSNNFSQVAETFHGILKDYESSDLLKIANKAYIQEGVKFKPDYIALTKEKYLAEAEILNLIDKISAANAMNTWVEQKTNGKINNLISPDSLEDNMRFVLLNALHFKGQWINMFDPENTMTDDFWINNEKSVKVDFMYQEEKFNYIFDESLNCFAVEIPYANSDLSMFMLLPVERDGLQELAQKLHQVNLVDMAKKMRNRNAYVQIPKFKIDYAIEISDVLKEMGILHAFSNKANFSKILEPAENICISKVFHKVSIDVNEEGSEADAATLDMPSFCCLPPQFMADHPFFYWIWNKKNIVLFAGAFVTAPKKV